MAKISKEEYEVLKELDDKWKWIARDENTNFVNIFEEKPYKDTPIWMWRRNSYVGRIESDMSLFQFIQWEDSEPYNISELIEEYEGESGEVEVKRNLKEAILGIEITQFDGYKADLEEFVNPRQLEEVINDWMPEVLSQKWIDEHAKAVTYDGIPDQTEVVYVDDLQNLLVPKREEVDRAYKDGYEKRKEHATRDDEPETVASVMADFFGAAARLKEVLVMEVGELEE